MLAILVRIADHSKWSSQHIEFEMIDSPDGFLQAQVHFKMDCWKMTKAFKAARDQVKSLEEIVLLFYNLVFYCCVKHMIPK